MRLQGEFELKRVVVTVYAPVTWTDEQAIKAIEGDTGATFRVKETRDVVKHALNNYTRLHQLPEGVRIEVTE